MRHGRGIHRVTADSIVGRRMAQAKGARIADDSEIPKDILEHNRRIEEARAEKLARKQAQRNTNHERETP